MAKKLLTRKLVSVAEKEAALEALEQKRAVDAAPAIQSIIAEAPTTEPITNKENNTPKARAPKANREVHRFNIELPMDLYLDIKDHIDVSGQTLKGLLCLAAREYLQKQ